MFINGKQIWQHHSPATIFQSPTLSACISEFIMIYAFQYLNVGDFVQPASLNICSSGPHGCPCYSPPPQELIPKFSTDSMGYLFTPLKERHHQVSQVSHHRFIYKCQPTNCSLILFSRKHLVNTGT